MISGKKEEYVYVMSNPSFADDTLKVGWTRDHPNIRANDLHTSGLPTPFRVECVIVTNEGSKLEKRIHKHIQQYRLNSNREFFKILKDILMEILTNELNLKLTSIAEIIMHHKKHKMNKIINLYEILKKDADEFFSKFKSRIYRLRSKKN